MLPRITVSPPFRRMTYPSSRSDDMSMPKRSASSEVARKMSPFTLSPRRSRSHFAEVSAEEDTAWIGLASSGETCAHPANTEAAVIAASVSDNIFFIVFPYKAFLLRLTRFRENHRSRVIFGGFSHLKQFSLKLLSYYNIPHIIKSMNIELFSCAFTYRRKMRKIKTLRKNLRFSECFRKILFQRIILAVSGDT